jgi:hypothetical protein
MGRIIKRYVTLYQEAFAWSQSGRPAGAVAPVFFEAALKIDFASFGEFPGVL